MGQGDQTPHNEGQRETGETARNHATRVDDSAARDATLTAAILRIGASLDLDTVLKEVVESARALTGAACGAITTVDEAGTPRDFVTSGMTDEQHRSMEAWPDGPPLFEHLRALTGPLRLPDLDTWVRALGRARERAGVAPRSIRPPVRCRAGPDDRARRLKPGDASTYCQAGPELV